MNINYRDIFKIPNIISISRVILILPFLYFLNNKSFYATFAFMIIIILTDFLDGFLSRRLNSVTELGKILDPVADKICLGIGLLSIFAKSGVDPIVVYILILRDVFILSLGFFLSSRLKNVPSSNIFGKLTSFFLSILGVVSFLKVFYYSYIIQVFILFFWYLSLIFIILSSISYFLRFISALNKNN